MLRLLRLARQMMDNAKDCQHGGAAQPIVNVLQVIDKIADQTNLLALNIT